MTIGNYFVYTMKYRALLVAVVLGIGFVTLSVRASYPATPGSLPGTGKSLGNNLGPDITKNTWQPWQAPIATVNPEILIPSDNLSGSNTSAGPIGAPLAPVVHTSPAQLGKLFNQGATAKLEGAKPIEEVGLRSSSPVFNEPAAPVPAPKPHETKRILLVAVISVAILAYRKFRRSNVGPAQKPSFL